MGFRGGGRRISEALEWGALASTHPKFNLYQCWEYEALRGGGCRFEGWALPGGGCALVRIRRFGRRGPGLAQVYWGPLCSPPEDEERFAVAVRALRRIYVVEEGLLLRVLPPLCPEPSVQERIFRAEGFLRVEDPPPYRTFVVDLRSGPEVVKEGFRRSFRYNVNRSLRNGFQMEVGKETALFDRFLDLYDRMWKRKRFRSGVDPRKFRELQDALPDSRKMEIRIVGKEGTDLAAAVHSFLGDTVLYLLGATRVEGRIPPDRKYAAHLLHWRVIEEACRRGFAFYDLGGIDPEENPGVHSFKNGFGGSEARNGGCFEAWESSISKGIVNLGLWVRRIRAGVRGRGAGRRSGG